MDASHPLAASVNKLSSLSQRLLVAIVLIPIGAVIIMLGGWVFYLAAMLILGVAAWEYWRMFSNGGYRPSVIMLVGGTVVMVLTRALWGMERAEGLLALVVMTAMGYQVFVFPRKPEDRRAGLSTSTWAGCFTWAGWGPIDLAA